MRRPLHTTARARTRAACARMARRRLQALLSSIICPAVDSYLEGSASMAEALRQVRDNVVAVAVEQVARKVAAKVVAEQAAELGRMLKGGGTRGPYEYRATFRASTISGDWREAIVPGSVQLNGRPIA